MLIGSRYNSAYDMDTSSTPDTPQHILGSSLVLLQQQLDSAATDVSPNNSYRNVLSYFDKAGPSAAAAAAVAVVSPVTGVAVMSNHNNINNVGNNQNPVRRSAGAATALATLRPGSGGNRRVSSSVPHHPSAMQFETKYNSHNHSHDPHFKLHPLEFHSDHDGGDGAGGGVGGVGGASGEMDGHGQLLTDDSQSSLGSDMFAFRVGKKTYLQFLTFQKKVFFGVCSEMHIYNVLMFKLRLAQVPQDLHGRTS